MPKPKPPTKDEKPQKKRFIETAKEVGADESKEAFERAFKNIVPKKTFSQKREH